MRKTAVVLLTSLLLASLPAQGGHTEDPGRTDGGTPPVFLDDFEEVAHDCFGDYGVSEPGNDVASVWVGTRDLDDDDGENEDDDEPTLVIVDVVLGGRTEIDSDGVAARLYVSFQTNTHNDTLTTVLESIPDPATTSSPRDDWRSASSIVTVESESNLLPVFRATRTVDAQPEASAEGVSAEARTSYRVVELGYRFSDVFAPGTKTTEGALVINPEGDSWHVETFYEEGGFFTSADELSVDDSDCPEYQNEESDPPLTPESPKIADITATPSTNIHRLPESKVRFRVDVVPGGGDLNRVGYLYNWTFSQDGADDITSTDPEPLVRFLVYNQAVDVTVEVTDDLGRSVTKAVPNLIEAGDFTNLGPTADFTISPETPEAGEEVTFTDRSFDREGYEEGVADGDQIVGWTWDFGDGSALVHDDQSPTHTYTTVGIYNVRLTAEDEYGGTNTRTLTIFVCDELDESEQVCKPPNAGPTASFVANATLVAQGGSIRFNDTSTDRDGTIEAWHWDFGDDSDPATTRNATHTFDEVGLFHVTLTVTDDGGLQGTRVIPVRVTLAEPDPQDGEDEPELLPPPLAAFTIDPEEPVAGKPVRFRDATVSESTIVSWTWFFFDGSGVGHGADVTHTFNETGAHRVRLTVTDEFGVRDTIEQTFVVGPGAEGEDAPGLPVVLLLVSLAAAVALRRR